MNLKILQREKWEKHKLMENKQHATKKKKKSQWRNQRGNQKIPEDKWKWNIFPKMYEMLQKWF